MPATAIRSLLPPILIVVLFYGYTGAVGDHYPSLDIAIFVVSVFTGEYAGHLILQHEVGRASRAIAGAALMTATVAFATLSFFPPPLFLFDVPALIE